MCNERCAASDTQHCKTILIHHIRSFFTGQDNETCCCFFIFRCVFVLPAIYSSVPFHTHLSSTNFVLNDVWVCVSVSVCLFGAYIFITILFWLISFVSICSSYSRCCPFPQFILSSSSKYTRARTHGICAHKTVQYYLRPYISLNIYEWQCMCVCVWLSVWRSSMLYALFAWIHRS